jgi:CBS domain-containing protein
MTERNPEVEAYLDEKEPRHRVLDNGVLREPVSMLEPREPVCVQKGSSIADAIRRMQESRTGYVLVVENGILVGICTERDVLRHLVGDEMDPAKTLVEEIMTPDPETLSADADIAFALSKMSHGGFRHVPLVDELRRPVGIVSVRHIVDYIVDFFPEVLNVPPEPGLDVAKAREGA